MASSCPSCSSTPTSLNSEKLGVSRRMFSRRAMPTVPRSRMVVRAAGDVEQEPLLIRASRGEKVERPPCWMMRQAGRYQQAFRDVAKAYPSFRQRSETTDLIVEISLQPWESFKPDGVILFSDILTPLPAFGVPFEIDDARGPILSSPVRTLEEVSALTPIDVDKLSFVGDSLRQLRQHIGNQAAVLGFVGAPWTLATYVIEGGSSSYYKTIKSMIHSNPETLSALLSFLADQIGDYIIYQIEAGAHAIEIFDSWGGQLPPQDWDTWSKPYITRMVERVKEAYPTVPLTLYANGSGGLLERMNDTGVDVMGLDWTVDMADARARLGPDMPVQGNVDPVVLFAGEEGITEAVKNCLAKAGPRGHILNLGHGVLVGTPEENVAHMFNLSKQAFYDEASSNDVVRV